MSDKVYLATIHVVFKCEEGDQSDYMAELLREHLVRYGGNMFLDWAFQYNQSIGEFSSPVELEGLQLSRADEEDYAIQFARDANLIPDCEYQSIFGFTVNEVLDYETRHGYKLSLEQATRVLKHIDTKADMSVGVSWQNVEDGIDAILEEDGIDP